MISTLSTFAHNVNMAELTAHDAAHVVGVNRQTILRWCWKQYIQCRKYGLRGDWRIDADDLRRFAHQHGYKFNEELARQLASD